MSFDRNKHTELINYTAKALDALGMQWEADCLPAHLSTFMWLNNGDYIDRTIYFDTTLGIVAVAGDRDAVFNDYINIREVEKELIIDPYEPTFL